MRSKLQVVDVSTSELLKLAGGPAPEIRKKEKKMPSHDGGVRERQVQHLPIIGIMRRMLNTKRFHDIMQRLMLPADQNVASAGVAVHHLSNSCTVAPFDASIDIQP
jgi:hypothetical protein